MTVAAGARAESLGWQDIPVDLRSKMAFTLGAGVVRVLRQDAGVPDALAARLHLDDGRWVFLRALPPGHPRIADYRAEARIGALLPDDAPVPKLLCYLEQDWVTMVCSDLDGSRPNLRPGSPDCSATLTALGKAARTMTPCPLPSAPDVVTTMDALTGCWARLAADRPGDLDPWLPPHLDSLAALDTAWRPWADGDTLLHNDLRADTMVRTGTGRVLITGWRAPAKGAAWLDFVAMIPQLLAAGHTVATAERLVLRRPELRGVPAWAITGYAVARAGHAQLTERRGVTARATLRWIQHRTRW